ncbi:hypothetical protein JCM17092_25760 [Haloplanus litoreus]
MCGHIGDNVETVYTGDDEANTYDPCKIDLLVERDDTDSCDCDDPEGSPRPIDDTNRKILQRERKKVESSTVSNEYTQTR